MKKFVFFLIFSLIVTLGYSQVADVGEFRIANATTAFGRNLPVGTKVYNIADGKYWVAIDGVGKTETLTTGAAKFDLLNVKVRAEDVPIDDLGGFYTGTDVEAALQEVGDSITNYNNRLLILEGFDEADPLFNLWFNDVSFQDSVLFYETHPEFATLQEALIGIDNTKIISPLTNRQVDSLVNVPYSGALENIYSDYNITVDTLISTSLQGTSIRAVAVDEDGRLIDTTFVFDDIELLRDSVIDNINRIYGLSDSVIYLYGWNIIQSDSIENNYIWDSQQSDSIQFLYDWNYSQSDSLEIAFDSLSVHRVEINNLTNEIDALQAVSDTIEVFYATPSQTSFTLANEVTKEYTVSQNGIILPATAYSINTNTLTVSVGVWENDRIQINYKY